MQSEENANGAFKFKGTIVFPKREEERREVAAEVLPPKKLPWGWIFLTGSLLFSLIISLSSSSEK